MQTPVIKLGYHISRQIDLSFRGSEPWPRRVSVKSALMERGIERFSFNGQACFERNFVWRLVTLFFFSPVVWIFTFPYQACAWGRERLNAAVTWSDPLMLLLYMYTTRGSDLKSPSCCYYPASVLSRWRTRRRAGGRLDWDSNCHLESDKVLICRLAMSDWTSLLTNGHWNKPDSRVAMTKCLQPVLGFFIFIYYHSSSQACLNSCGRRIHWLYYSPTHAIKML